MNQRHDLSPEHPGAAGHETTDADVRVLAVYAVVLAVFLVAVHIGMLAVYRTLVTYRTPEGPIDAPVNIYDQLHALRRAEDETLASYGWVDRKQGVVRIPIDRAIDLALERGVPKGKGPRTEAELNSHHGTILPIPEPSTPGETKAEPAPRAEASPAETAKPKESQP